MPAKRVGIGCVRVSSDRQERSIDEQKDSIRAEAGRDGVHMLEGEAWCEDDGVSGSILDRPGLQKLLALCATRDDITDVYFWKRNRLARSTDPLDGLNIERQMEKAGKRVHFVQGMRKTGNKILDFLASGLEYAEAGQYLVNLSSDVIRGLVPLTKQGYDAGRPTPYGFDRMVVDPAGKELYRIRSLGNGVRHKIFPDGKVEVFEKGRKPAKESFAHSVLVPGEEQRVAVVRRIFEAHAYEEKGIRSIAEELNLEKVPSARGGLWGVGAVRSMLVNPVYYGANIWNVRSFSKYHSIENGTPVPHEPDGRSKRMNPRKHWIVADETGCFQGLVSKELFDLAQAKRSARKAPFRRGQAVSAPYYLSGLLVCACGHSLHGSTKTSGKKNGWRKNYYYTCGGYAMKGRSVCRRYWLPREMIEGPVMEALQKRIRSIARLESIRKQVRELVGDFGTPEGNIKVLERQLVAIDKKALRWKKAIDKGLNMDEAVKHLNDLGQERSAVQADLDLARTRKGTSLDVDSVTAEIMAGLEKMQRVIEEGSVAEVKAILRRYIARIEYVPGKDKARIGFYDLPIQALVSESAAGNSDLCMVARVGFEPTTYGL